MHIQFMAGGLTGSRRRSMPIIYRYVMLIYRYVYASSLASLQQGMPVQLPVPAFLFLQQPAGHQQPTTQLCIHVTIDLPTPIGSNQQTFIFQFFFTFTFLISFPGSAPVMLLQLSATSLLLIIFFLDDVAYCFSCWLHRSAWYREQIGASSHPPLSSILSSSLSLSSPLLSFAFIASVTLFSLLTISPNRQ